jgi:5'-nucleotidase
MPLPSPDLEAQLAVLLSAARSEIDVARRNRVFCNRNLRMESIELIGFDMDYTLALYHQDKLEQLSIDLTLGKLIENHGYPADIRGLAFDSVRAIRGIVVDKERGNVFKMDRHAHVGRVYHGDRQLTREERRDLYRHEKINLSLDRYAWIDTLFGLPEAVMYIALVAFLDRTTTTGAVDYVKLFDDIRASIDEAHRDDTLKSVIKADLAGYIIKDPHLAETLHKLRSSGKKLFLLTNSAYDYTSAVMSFLLDGERRAYPSWRNYFDYVVVAGAKPAFFIEQRPFVQIDPASGAAMPAEVKALHRGNIYQGGNIAAFEDMTHIRGEHVLYIGDHIYGDILKLRKAHMWRTAMVLQELEREMTMSERMEHHISDLDLLDRRRRNLESEIDYQSLLLKRLQKLIEDNSATATNGNAALRVRLEEAKKQAKLSLDSLRDRARLMVEEVDSLEDAIDRSYNPYWGSMLREGNENSRFGEQVNDYADLYTSRVSNFLYYSPLRYFRAPRRQMPHEL